MKKYFIQIAFLFLIYFVGCDKPGPTELISEDDTFDVEILGKDLENDEYYSNGYDTSGVVQTNYDYASLVSVSGIKVTANGLTTNLSSAQAYIFDRSEPFYSPNNILLGYKTITPGIIRFDNVQARLTNYRVLYREDGNIIDSVLGKKYELFKRHGRIWGDPFTFQYNSQIDFSFNAFIGGQQSNFQIQTPQEVNGNVKLVNVNERKYRAELNWNGESANNFFIIIGGIKIANEKVFPLFKLKTKDDGKLNIPKTLFENIPDNRFNKIVISFVRQYGKVVQGINNDIYVSSQSIHTIIVDIP